MQDMNRQPGHGGPSLISYVARNMVLMRMKKHVTMIPINRTINVRILFCHVFLLTPRKLTSTVGNIEKAQHIP